jgi:hypothetical protein
MSLFPTGTKLVYDPTYDAHVTNPTNKSVNGDAQFSEVLLRQHLIMASVSFRCDFLFVLPTHYTTLRSLSCKILFLVKRVSHTHTFTGTGKNDVEVRSTNLYQWRFIRLGRVSHDWRVLEKGLA